MLYRTAECRPRGGQEVSPKTKVGSRLVSFTASPKHPLKPENPSLIKSAFCCVQSCVPSAWASAIRHGGQWRCFLSIVGDALLPGHVLASAQCMQS